MGRYKKEEGYLVEVPIYCDHKRGRNWLAIITPDPKSPGGLNRDFCEHGRGKFVYYVDGLEPGDVLEFGADYYTTSGKKRPERLYAVVISNTVDYLEIEEFNDPELAFKYAKEHFSSQREELNRKLKDVPLEEILRELELRGYDVSKLVKKESSLLKIANELLVIASELIKFAEEEEFNFLSIFTTEELVEEVKKRISEL